MRLRNANNILIFYDYEIPQSNNSLVYFKSKVLNIWKDKSFYSAFFDFSAFKEFVISANENYENYTFEKWQQISKLFELDKQKQTSMFDIEKKVLELKVLKSNANARKDNFIDLVNANIKGYCFMVTLTYDEENKRLLQDLEKAHSDFKKFIQRYNYALFGSKKNKLKYVAVWELQEKNDRGAIHYHLIFFDMPNETLIKGKKLDLNLLRKTWGLGLFVNVKKIRKITSGLGKYLSKYMFKTFDDYICNKKRYFSSKNLVRPRIDRVVCNDNNKLVLESGELINLNDFEIEKVEMYETKFTGKTKKITYRKK